MVDGSLHSIDNLKKKKKNLLHPVSLLYLHFSSSFKSSFCFHWMYWSSWDFPKEAVLSRSSLLTRSPLCGWTSVPIISSLWVFCALTQPAGNTLDNSIQGEISYLKFLRAWTRGPSVWLSHKCVWQGGWGGLGNDENSLVTVENTINIGWVLPMSSILISHLDTFFSVYFHKSPVMYYLSQLCRTENQKDEVTWLNLHSW